MRSKPERKEPDLFLFGLPGFFKGYFPGYSKAFFTDDQPTTAAADKGEHLERDQEVPLHLGDPQGAHQQHRRLRAAAQPPIRATRRDQLQILRRGERPAKRGSRRRWSRA